MTTASLSQQAQSAWFTPRWGNWRLALLAALIVIPLAIAALPPEVSFWVSGAACALVALTAVVNAWGRYTGGLLGGSWLTALTSDLSSGKFDGANLVSNFASQWLHLRNLDAVTPDLRLFPDFDENLRRALRTARWSFSAQSYGK